MERRTRILLVAVAASLAVVLLGIAALPAGWLKDEVEKRLSRQVGREVSIGAIGREDALSFTPVIALSDVTIPQASWAGQGRLATIRSLRIRINTLAALVGRAEPSLLSASGAELNLVRAEDRRVNWRTGADSDAQATVSLAQLERLDAVVHYRDAYQNRAFRIALKLDPETGFSADGSGEVAGNPVKIFARGAKPGTGRWPFKAAIAGDAVDLRIDGTMSRPLDTNTMQFRAEARASDLKLVDRIIEAGLFGTQPVDLSVNVDRDGSRWTLSSLTGTIGGRYIAGQATIVKAGADISLDASLHSKQLDFDDLASDAGNAAAIALERAAGLRIVPNTPINLEKVALTKGRLAIRIDRIVSARRPSALRSLDGVLTLDGKLLVARPLNVALARGTISGAVIVDQRDGRPQPLVQLALDLQGSSINALFGGSGAIDAPIDGRMRLVGTGDTIREAVGRSNGQIGVFASAGAMPDKLATLMAFDVGRTLFANDQDRASLRCAAIRLNVKQGLGIASPLLIDTGRSQARGQGSIRFPDERMSLAFTGAPKGGTVLRVPGVMLIGGTVREPEVMVSRKVRSFGNVLKGIGRAITGHQGPTAADADCADLRTRTLSG